MKKKKKASGVKIRLKVREKTDSRKIKSSKKTKSPKRKSPKKKNPILQVSREMFNNLLAKIQAI